MSLKRFPGGLSENKNCIILHFNGLLRPGIYIAQIKSNYRLALDRFPLVSQVILD